ncbi:MAG: zf-HC2 domain-containing protein [Marinilabiliales bacterium]|nr:zf-HC2 domain-containing protein [Marinilabiliales bacterium]
MTCDKIQEKFADYLTGDLDEAGRDEVREHIAACAACREDLENLTVVWAKLGVLPEEQPSGAVRSRFYDDARGIQERGRAAARLAGMVQLPAPGLRRFVLGPPAPHRTRRGLAHERRPRGAAEVRQPLERGPEHAPGDGPVAARPAVRHGADPGRRLHRRGRETQRRNARRALRRGRPRPEPQRPAGRGRGPLSLPRQAGRARKPGQVPVGPDLPSRPGRPHRLPGRSAGGAGRRGPQGARRRRRTDAGGQEAGRAGLEADLALRKAMKRSLRTVILIAGALALIGAAGPASGQAPRGRGTAATTWRPSRRRRSPRL